MSSNLQMKILAKETAIYGASSIVGKFLNWLLVPLYTYVLQQQSDYGIVTNLYAWTALLLVILTYGMETGFFRFVNKAEENPKTVYSTSLIALFTTSLLFSVACVVAFAFEVDECPEAACFVFGYTRKADKRLFNGSSRQPDEQPLQSQHCTSHAWSCI